jgi:hypothetical protein
MITERELRRIAGRFNLGVGQAEHEYAMLCVLDALGQTSPLGVIAAESSAVDYDVVSTAETFREKVLENQRRGGTSK